MGFAFTDGGHAEGASSDGTRTGGVPDADALRTRYRQLMMRHHPDVDPSGLERCKDVNVAYALLIAGTAVE